MCYSLCGMVHISGGGGGGGGGGADEVAAAGFLPHYLNSP